MKGIILAGGSGTRLYPCTISVSKQLLPIYDKPLIYYPLSMLMLAKIREILIITTPQDIDNYKKLLGDGSRIGVHFEYAIQEKPRGLADAFIVGEKFIGNDSVCLVLGDNVFYGAAMSNILEQAKRSIKDGGASIFGCLMKNPQDFGVVEFDKNRKVISIEEKPQKPKSNYAVPGLYFYDNQVVEIAKNVKPSLRGEIEISSVNEEYLKRKQLHVTLMTRGVTWFDTGSPKGMHKASGFVKTLQEMQGFYLSCIEEIAWRKHFIDDVIRSELAEDVLPIRTTGETIDNSRASSSRICFFIVKAENEKEMLNKIKQVYEKIDVVSSTGESLLRTDLSVYALWDKIKIN